MSNLETRSRAHAFSRPLAWFCFFLIATIFFGLMLRWQMAGFSATWLGYLDLRRTHSHLGFYGLLFPAAWIYLETQGAWVPKGPLLLGYFLLVTVSAVGFLTQGYGLVAIVGSTGILAVWLLFAWKNRPGKELFRRDWLASSSLSILVAACMIPLVAVMTHRDPELANRIARTFLTLLLFGVFIPTSLRFVGRIPPHALGWFVATLFGGVYLTELYPNPIFGIGLVWIGAEIVRSVWSAGKPRIDARTVTGRIRLFWMLFGLGLALTGIGALPHAYYPAIAGIHFLVLGPILMTFVYMRLRLRPKPFLQVAYEASVAAMVTAILLEGLAPTELAHLQRVAAVAGSLVVASILLIIASIRLQRIQETT